MRIYLLIISGLLIGICFCGCSLQKPEDLNETIRDRSEDASRLSESLHSYLVGELAAKNQNYPKAIRELKKTQKLTNNPTVSGRLAFIELQTGNLELALQESQRALEQSPQDAKLLALHGVILEAQHRDEEALQFYQKATSSDVDSVQPVILQAQLLYNQGKKVQADESLRRALVKNPTSYQIYLILSRLQEEQGNLSLAFIYAKKGFDLSNRQYESGLNLIRILLKLKKNSEAKSVCLEMIKKEEKSENIRKILAQIFISESKFDEAVDQLTIAERTSSEKNEFELAISLIDVKRGRLNDASSRLEELIRKDIDNSDVVLALANIYVAQKKNDQALLLLDRIDSTDTLYSKAQVMKAALLREEKDFTSAIEAIKNALGKGKKEVGVLLYLASLQKENHEYKDAIETLDTVMKISERNDKILYDYAVLAQLDEQTEKAKFALIESLKLNPNNVESLNFIAYIMAEKEEDLNQALKLAKKALSLNPEDPYIMDTIGWIYFHQGESKLSIDYLSESYKKVPTDIVIIHHYFEALLTLNQLDDAKKIIINLPKFNNWDRDAKKSFDRINHLRKEYNID